jgi:hypothetical protein
MIFYLYILNIACELLLVLNGILIWYAFVLHVDSALESAHNSVEELWSEMFSKMTGCGFGGQG